MASGGVLEQQMRDTLSCYDMMRAGDKVLVAISGGPDSVSLLHALWALAAELDIELAAAHLNHKLRGTEADRDEPYVQQLCEGWYLDCVVRSEDIAGRASAGGLSRAQAGRVAPHGVLATRGTEHLY